MARCIFEDLTPEQAETLAEWFCGQREQDCEIWFDAHDGLSPQTDTSRKGGYKEVTPEGDVIVHCKTP